MIENLTCPCSSCTGHAEKLRHNSLSRGNFQTYVYDIFDFSVAGLSASVFC